MNEDILATQKIIERQVNEGNVFNFGIPFSKYQKVYACTNENINGYTEQLNFANKENALSVMASGDHAFNLVCEGILNIDTFDTNVLTEYYALGIKRAAIMAFEYDKYLEFFKKIVNENISLEELTDLIKVLLPYMDEKYRRYWIEILDFNYQIQKCKNTNLNLFHILQINIKNMFSQIIKNNYLLNESNYNQLRKNLMKANISFQECECLSLPYVISKNYDFIFLSNISDYFYKNLGHFWSYDKLRNIEKEFSELLKDDGVNALAYIFCCYNIKLNCINSCLFADSKVKTDELIDEKIILIPHIVDNQESRHSKDGLILTRKL